MMAWLNRTGIAAGLLVLGACAAGPGPSGLALRTLKPVARVDERFQSYNVEMVEVTGGRFWAPYGGPPGEVYRMRPPADLSDRRLRALARLLGPAYMRVSGTWANSTYLEAEGEHVQAPPAGFEQVLTRAQWRSVFDFARAVDAKVGVSFAVSAGTRGPDGGWTTAQAQRLADLTREAGGEIAFAEFINEPNAAALGRLPKGYSVADYARDNRIFLGWARQALAGTTIVGPGSVGEGALDEGIPVALPGGILKSEELMASSPDTLDAVSYHFYGNVSQRCAAMRPAYSRQDEALSPAWLDRTLRDLRFYGRLRDRFEPGDALWITETAQAACGGSPWAASFLDSFRYVNQLGLLARHGVRVVMHNTLAASDYALIDGETLEPRPNFWAAVLWKRTMGATVLAAPASPAAQLRLYAHCSPRRRGAVGLAAINLGEDAQQLAIGGKARAWVMRASPLDSPVVEINGRRPAVGPDGTVSGLEPAPVAGRLTVPGQAIAFIEVAGAGNPACVGAMQ